jgi:D-psicose/D-tagatose/L-ribulose 3-epimerase
MIRLGINTMVWSGAVPAPRSGLFERLRAWGYEAVEVPVFDFAAFDAVPLGRAAADAGLALSVSSALPSNLSLAGSDPNIRRETRCWLQTAVEKTAAAGGSILAGPLYLPVGLLAGRRRSEDEWSRAVDELRALTPAIRGSGVRIAIEPLNRFETYFLNTAADARRLCDQVADDSVGALFDTFHANIEEDSIEDAIRALGASLIHVHLSENHRGVPGSGHVPFRLVSDTLASRGYTGLAIVESFASSIPEIAAATAMWRDYAASPDDFARRSVENLRRVF